MDLLTYPECVSCQVTLTGLRFVLFSSISALLIMKPSVEITHGCFVRLEPPRHCGPCPLGPRRFEQCLAAREWGCLSGARECSQAGLPPVPHAGGCLHLLRPAHGRSAPPRCGHANSRRQLHRPGTCDPPTCTHVVTSRWCRGTTVASESRSMVAIVLEGTVGFLVWALMSGNVAALAMRHVAVRHKQQKATQSRPNVAS